MSRHVIAIVGELPPGGRKRVTISGRDIALFRLGDSYHAIADRCPHEGASLCAGRIGGLPLSERPGSYRLERQGEMLRCPWHGWEFDIRTGHSWTDPERLRVRSFPACVESGAALVRGPHVAETYPVTVTQDYVLVDLAPSGWTEVVVAARRQVAERIVALELARPDGTKLPGFTPGQHVNVEIAPGLVRPFSLCGEPDAPYRYRIAVLREAQSRGGSVAVHAGLAEGTRLRISPPRGSFTLAPTTRAVLLIAGGIGITPLLPMAWYLARQGAPFALHYLARGTAQAAFLEELRDGSLAPHLHTHFAPDRCDVPALLATQTEAEIYVCGPARLIGAVTAAHAALGLPPERLHLERFTTEVMKDGTPFEVECRASGITLQVPAGRSLAEVLVENGIPVDLSCEQGLCGACLLPVLEGTPEHRDSVQSATEQATNHRIAACCSRARTPRLVLDI